MNSVISVNTDLSAESFAKAIIDKLNRGFSSTPKEIAQSWNRQNENTRGLLFILACAFIHILDEKYINDDYDGRNEYACKYSALICVLMSEEGRDWRNCHVDVPSVEEAGDISLFTRSDAQDAAEKWGREHRTLQQLAYKLCCAYFRVLAQSFKDKKDAKKDDYSFFEESAFLICKRMDENTSSPYWDSPPLI